MEIGSIQKQIMIVSLSFILIGVGSQLYGQSNNELPIYKNPLKESPHHRF